MPPRQDYRIDDAVFKQFPGYVRGVVLAQNVCNGASPEDLISILRSTENDLRNTLSLDTLIKNPPIASWRDAYRSFGSKPSKFRPSVEAMARRILKGDSLPSINALVDIGNVISLRYLVPAGGHAIDEVKGDLTLRPAAGDETFNPFGSDTTEHPDPGEIIFTEGNIVLTRRWTWRQAMHTLTLPETTAIEFNVDGLPPVTQKHVRTACEELVKLVGQFCGGDIQTTILTHTNSSLTFTGAVL